MEESDERDLSSAPEDEPLRQEPYGSTEENLEYESDIGGDSYDEDELSSTLTASELSAGMLAPTDLSKITHEDRVKMLHLRRYLDQLSEKVLQKDYVVQKTREELKKCQTKLAELLAERLSVLADITTEENNENTAATYRLKSQLERVHQEMELEKQLETEIKTRIYTAENELYTAQVEQGRYLLADAELTKEEEKFGRERSEMAGQRLKKEQHYAAQADRRRRSRERDNHGAIRERERKHRQAMAEARRSREKASKFLKQTLSQVRHQESEEEIRDNEELERRIQTVMSLKQNISSNKENMRALQARDHARAITQLKADEEERDDIIAQGVNPEYAMLVVKRKHELQKQQEVFEANQEANQVEIVGKILREEQRMKKRMQQQPQLWHDTKREKTKRIGAHRKRKLKIFHESGSSSMEYSADVEEDMKSPEKHESQLAPLSSDEEKPAANIGTKTILPESDSEGEEAKVLAKPEFEGLWDKHKPYNAPKQASPLKSRLAGATKMEQDIMEKVLEKHRSGMVRQQVVCGKEFKGVAFYSKPDVIHFKDFEVGKIYRKKVILTNVSYSVNHCKLLGLTESLKDFIHLQFDPPGHMSAGLTCELIVTFKPMINEDLEGTVDFKALTGPFSVPLTCTIKKCDLSIDVKTLDFGSTVIGETLKRTFRLSNNGALSTRFELYKRSGLKQRAVEQDESVLGGMPSEDENGSTAHAQNRSPSPVKQESKSSQKLETDEDGGTAQRREEDQGGDQPKEEVDEVERTFVQSSLDGVEDAEEFDDLDGFSVGQIKSGEIGPFSTVVLEIVWQPTIPGPVTSEFVLIFDDPNVEKIELSTLANAIDVPVWLQRQDIDLKICMYDRLYQDTIIVHNRASTALRLKFEVCKELRNHIELLPKTGYIQAQSTFSAQLKFLPRKSLAEDGGPYFDVSNGVLEAAMTVIVADQTRPVPFVVHAVVTNSDMRFDVDHIDFGHATIYEAVKKTIHLTNESILQQKYGFVGLPQFVDVQPNDGFGTLLPLETVSLDVIFSPTKAGNYNFELTCKSIINREFKVTCSGVGVHPPLKLSSDVVNFQATAMDDVAEVTLQVVNEHTSTNEFTHPVPRIGKGEICPVGPTSFEFVIPDGAPITISPCVGTVDPGQKCSVHVRYSPTLTTRAVKMEAVEVIKKNLAKRAMERQKQALLEQQKLAMAERKKERNAKGGKGGKGARGGKGGKAETAKSPTKKTDPSSVLQVDITGTETTTVPEWDAIDAASDEYAQAHCALLRQYAPQFATYVVPCYVASGRCSKPGQLQYSIHNTLYLVVHCPSVRPEMAVISDNGRQTTSFGEVSRGQSVIKSVTIQNISDHMLHIRGSILDTSGPFLVLNSFRPLAPDATHTLLVSFTPGSSEKYYEVLEISTGRSRLHVTFRGQGVQPRMSLSVDGVLDMGAVISGEYLEKTFTIGNSSTLAIDYAIKQDSMSLIRHAQAQELPEFVQRDRSARMKRKYLVGTQNNNGSCVFNCVPSEGKIVPGSTIDVMVTFAPDHDSDYYSDGIRLELFGLEETHFFQITGQAKPHIMYMAGGDDLRYNVESLAVLPVSTDEEDVRPPPKVLLLSLYSKMEGDQGTVAKGEVFAGCVRTMAVSQKKNGEFFCENPANIMAKGFNVEPQKGQVEAGTKKSILFTWTPLPKHDPNVTVEAQILFTVKGDVTETYLVMLRGFIVADDKVHKPRYVTERKSPTDVVKSKTDVNLKSTVVTTSQTSITASTHGITMPVVVPP